MISPPYLPTKTVGVCASVFNFFVCICALTSSSSTTPLRHILFQVCHLSFFNSQPPVFLQCHPRNFSLSSSTYTVFRAHYCIQKCRIPERCQQFSGESKSCRKFCKAVMCCMQISNLFPSSLTSSDKRAVFIHV